MLLNIFNNTFFNKKVTLQKLILVTFLIKKKYFKIITVIFFE